jgi:formylglycine-generating enzyme required for sulfatase activity/uncharacterized surface protein with fasciclin (FAS1) repeats
LDKLTTASFTALSIALVLTSLPTAGRSQSANQPERADRARRPADADLVAAVTAARLPTLAAAIAAADLADTLRGDGPFTLFAPTEAAFAALPAGRLQALLAPENKQRLRDLLMLHVVPGRLATVEVANLDAPQLARTAYGSRLPVRADRRGFRYGDARVVDADRPCSNGLLHTIDQVLEPAPTRSQDAIASSAKATAPASVLAALAAVPDGRFTTFLAAVVASGADQDWAQPAAQGNWTLFVPTDDAFARLTAGERMALFDPNQRERLRALLDWHAIPELQTWSFEFDDRQRGATMVSRPDGRFVLDVLQNGMVFVYEPRAADGDPESEEPFKARILAGDLQVGGHLVHVVDRVLVKTGLQGEWLSSQAYRASEVAELAAGGQARADAIDVVDELLQTAERLDPAAASASYRLALRMLEQVVPVRRTSVLVLGERDDLDSLRERLRTRRDELDRVSYAQFLANSPSTASLSGEWLGMPVRRSGATPVLSVAPPTPAAPAEARRADAGPTATAARVGFDPTIGLSWATVLAAEVDPAVVTDADLRSAIAATGLPWRVRDKASGIELLLVPPGRFRMGASADDPEARSNESPSHEVILTRPFYLGRYEVSEAQWQRVMNRPGQGAATERPADAAGGIPGEFRITPRVSGIDEQGNPVGSGSVTATGADGTLIVTISLGRPASEDQPNAAGSPVLPATAPFAGGDAFCRAAGLRLPTEAEWEYACRAGSTTPRYGPFDAIAWHRGNHDARRQPIGTKAANALGFHDMLGSVWEWVNDWFGEYTRETTTDPKGPSTGTYRIVRGGHWDMGAADCRASQRYTVNAAGFATNVGFRVARDP